jgi:hypothetical protein
MGRAFDVGNGRRPLRFPKLIQRPIHTPADSDVLK